VDALNHCVSLILLPVNRLFLTTLLLALISVAIGQPVTFQRTYSPSILEAGIGLIATSDSGYLLSGNTKMLGTQNGDGYLVKTDYLGNPQWSKGYGGSEIEASYALGAFSNSFNNDSSQVYLIKTLLDGSRVATKTPFSWRKLTRQRS
jgi:hypothetical protein